MKKETKGSVAKCNYTKNIGFYLRNIVLSKKRRENLELHIEKCEHCQIVLEFWKWFQVTNEPTTLLAWDHKLNNFIEYQVVKKYAYHILIDGKQKWMPSEFTGCFVKITEGKGAGQVRRIWNNLNDIIFIECMWTEVPDKNSKYEILNNFSQNTWQLPTIEINKPEELNAPATAPVIGEAAK